MAALFFTIGAGLPVMIVPDVETHVDGHPVLSYNYHIYHDGEEESPEAELKQKAMLKDKKKSPNYMGFITFEQPGKLFTYTADGQRDLSAAEVQEVVENISHYRDHPGLWEVE